MSRPRTRLVIILWLLPLVPALNSCARTLRQPVQQSTPAERRSLWQEPKDLATRDLFHGVGGAAAAPNAGVYEFVSEKKSGTNPGYEVQDVQGRRWSVKLGDEAQSEVVASRILWAVGFHQPPVYYVHEWQLSGRGTPQQPSARFRLELRSQTVTSEWSWYDNPFIGSREFAALITVNLLLNNWDLKTANNKIYVVTNDDGVRQQWYVVRDLGGSLGKARQPRILSWFPFVRQKQGTKNTLEDFEAQGFVRGLDDGRVDFDYRGLDNALARSVTTDDLRWTSALLTRLSDSQWHDAFRAGGFTADQRTRYVRKIRDKLAQAAALVGPGRRVAVAASRDESV